MRIAIIGGGPSGLVQLKCLKEAHRRFPSSPLDVRLFESRAEIGGVFYSHAYEDAELVSSKFLTAFSDFPSQPDEPDFFSADRYREYLRDYATHFGLWPGIHLKSKVESVRRGDKREHVVAYRSSDCDAVAVCSGVHAIPHMPELPGVEHISVVMHAQDFKSREQFGEGKSVMVLGSGETGADICYLAVTSETKQVVLCHHNGWLGAPKRAPNVRLLPQIFGYGTNRPELPVDISQITLFDSMYVHPYVRDSMLIWNYYHNMAIEGACMICTGTPNGYDQWVGAFYGERRHASRLFFNKAWERIRHHVSVNWRPKEWSLPQRIRRYLFRLHEYPPPSRVIEVAPFPSHISSDGVAHFPSTGRPEAHRIASMTIKPDVLIFATGYLPAFPFFQTPANEGKRPYPIVSDTNVREIWKADDPTIGFIGFVRPGFGAIPPLAEMQAMLFTMNLLGQVSRALDPNDEWHYRIIRPPNARVDYGVEHDCYAYQLAKDIDGAPSFTEVLQRALRTKRGWRLPYIWALGGPLNVKFRMRGPWTLDDAAEQLTGPLWETIERREGMPALVSGTILPMMYLGAINLYFWIYCGLWMLFASIRLARPYRVRNEPKEIIEALRCRAELEKSKSKQTSRTE